MKISFHKPYFDEREAEAVSKLVRSGKLVGGGVHMKSVEKILRERFAVKHLLATNSGTSALELSMMTLGIGPGDEVIIPTYTFSSTANCVLRQGAKVIFCDVQLSDLNLDVADAASRISKKTKAILPVHYAGLPCRMEEIQTLAKQHGLFVVEDAAQAVDSFYQGKALGTFGEIGCYSFHGSKSIGCGEGGAIATNDDELAKRAEMMREKGTDRERFLRGEIDKYTWREQGSSFIPAELSMAVLEVQLSKMDEIRKKRGAIDSRYREGLADLVQKERFQFPPISKSTQPNYHICYVLFPDEKRREKALEELRKREIEALRHYYPLDSSPFGKQLRGENAKDLPNAKLVTERLLRLPLYTAMPMQEVDYVIEALHEILA